MYTKTAEILPLGANIHNKNVFLLCILFIRAYYETYSINFAAFVLLHYIPLSDPKYVSSFAPEVQPSNTKAHQEFDPGEAGLHDRWCHPC